jgi:hypothetical protein
MTLRTSIDALGDLDCLAGDFSEQPGQHNADSDEVEPGSVRQGPGTVNSRLPRLVQNAEVADEPAEVGPVARRGNDRVGPYDAAVGQPDVVFMHGFPGPAPTMIVCPDTLGSYACGAIPLRAGSIRAYSQAAGPVEPAG